MMGNTSRMWCLVFGMLLTAITLMGCSQKAVLPPENGYSSTAHLQYQEDAVQEQIEALEIGIADIKAQGGLVPPGYYAQLGLLYFSLSKTEQLRQRPKVEQDPFADATAYMNELMNNAKTAELPDPVDTPNPPEALNETSARINFNRERFSFVLAISRGNAQRFIF